MREEFARTVAAVKKLQTHRSNSLYRDFVDLLNELREDIRLANDYEDDNNQFLRNQGSIRILSELIKNMTAQPQQEEKPVIYDGGYTDI